MSDQKSIKKEAASKASPTEAKNKLSKQAFRLHRKIVLGREGLISALNTHNDSSSTSEGWAEKFSELSFKESSYDSSKILSSEVNITSLEFLMMEVVNHFLQHDYFIHGTPLELISNLNISSPLKSPPLSTVASTIQPRPRSSTINSYTSTRTAMSPPIHTSLKSANAASSTNTASSPTQQSQIWDLSLETAENLNTRCDEVFNKLENIGCKVGLGLVERFTIDHAPFSDTLDVIKFICKEFWVLLFHKQIDNLKTNHRGVYVLTDVRFPWLTRLTSSSTPNPLGQAATYTWFPCGLIRGALAGLGQTATVIAEVPTPPLCTFQVRIGKD